MFPLFHDVVLRLLTEHSLPRQALKKTLAVNKMNQSKIEEESKVHKKKIDKFESAFRKIKEATGVSDVNEVIQKIVSQEDTQNNLMELTRENQAKIEQLQDEKGAVRLLTCPNRLLRVQ